jgi:hypothetical protein
MAALIVPIRATPILPALQSSWKRAHGSSLAIASDVIVAGEAEPSHLMRVLDPVLTD